MLMLSRIRDHLSHLGLCNFISKDPAHSFSLGMNLEHNASCLGAVHREESLQYVDDEFHGGVVVVDEDYLVQRRALQFGRRFLDDQARPVPTSFYVTHGLTVYRVRYRGLQASMLNRPPKASVANRCHFTFTSKNKCLSVQAHSPYDCATLASLTPRGMTATEVSGIN